MSERSRLPALTLGSAAWDDVPPDPLAAPDLYDGVIWRRVLGYTVDIILIGIASIAVWIVFGLLGLVTLGVLSPLGAIALAILPIAYHTYFIGSQAATPGMALFDVEVRGWGGQRADYVQAFLMTALFYATIAVTAWIILAVALFNGRKRTLHDYLAATLVVRRSRTAAIDRD